MQHISIKDNVYRAILWPTLITLTFLSLTLASLYSVSLKEFSQQRAQALSEQLALIIEHSEQRNPELIEQLLKTTLQEPDIRALWVIDKDQRPLFQAGPKPGQLNESLDQNSTETFKGTYTGANTLFLKTLSLHPFPDSPATEKGTLVIEFITAPYSLLHTQTAMLAIIGLILGAITALYLAVKLSNRISAPLQKLQTFSQQLSQGLLASRIEEQDELELKPLVASFNSMALSLERAHQDMQHHIEQSTEDLQETLETIEEQNIELNFARKEALEASRTKSEFLANTSHEIRTPLNGIIGFSQLALKTPLTEQQQEYLATILESSQGLLSVINDIIDFSKLDSGKLSLDHIPLALNQCVEETLFSLSSQAQNKQLEMITLMDPDLPVNLLGDPLRFKQILNNLITNAIKFSESGNILVQLEKREIIDNRLTLKVTVSDSGVGLSEKQQRTIFQAFHQADNSDTRQHSGTGLGLAICKGLVEQMNGRIGVESELGHGASFWFSCDLGINTKIYSPARRDSIATKHIACFSSNPMTRLQISSLLEQWQCNVKELDDIETALSELGASHQAGTSCELLIIDIPYSLDKNQLQSIKKLIWQSFQRYNAKIIVAASSEHQKQINDSELSSIIQYIVKPIVAEPLRLAIQNQLASAQDSSPQIDKKVSSKPNILVVDDNAANRKLASELLKGLGADVTCADSGKAALTELDKKPSGMVFMDLQMPGMDGIETTQLWREQEQQRQIARIPIVALTAHAMEEKRGQLLLAGMDDFISKPISESQLKHLLKRWLKYDSTVSRQKPQAPVLNNTGKSQTEIKSPNLRVHHPVDLQECLKLTNQKADLAKDMLIMLLDSLNRDIPILKNTIRDNQPDLAQEIVHKLYGSSCYCGVPRLREISGKTDKALQKNNSKFSPEVLALLDQTLEAMNELHDWQGHTEIELLFSSTEDEKEYQDS